MSLLLADNELFATVNSEPILVDSKEMKYPDYAQRFKTLWRETEAAPQKSQKELAKWLGYSQATVSDWLNGEKLPAMETAIELTSKFNCCVEWLLSGRGPKQPGCIYFNKVNFIDVSKLSDEQRLLVEQTVQAFIKANTK